jgi:cytochrome P450
VTDVVAVRRGQLADAAGSSPAGRSATVTCSNTLRRLTRAATEDVEIAGTPVQRGEAVLVVAGSANHEGSRFPEPERFDITRTDRAHLGFGHGIHFCFGAPLALLEAEVAFAALYRRLPELRPAVPATAIRWRPPLSLRGPLEVPVRW